MKKKITSRSVFENIKAMGLVFGDIGTSPIYTLTVIFTLTAPNYPTCNGSFISHFLDINNFSNN